MTEEPWGRVDEQGQVFVRTADGERLVGSWLAGDPAEGLAFYRRRYEGLSVDIDLLTHRVGQAGLAPDEAMAAIGRLRAQLDEPACVGDLAALRDRLDALVAAVDARRAERAAERAAARATVLERRGALAAEAETLADSSRWKAGTERFRAIVSEWKELPRHDRAAEQELWHRISRARTAFDKSRRAHFAQRDSQRQTAELTKRGLVKEAEALSTSRDWGPTAAAYRDLMRRWKAAGPASRGAEDELWRRFRAAQDVFFSARSEVFAQRDSEQQKNLAAKEALAREAEGLLPPEDLAEARRRLRGIQDRWADVGHVPRQARDGVEGRLKAVEETLRGAEEARWRRSNPEGRARAADSVEQLTTAIARLEKQQAAALAAGDAKASEAAAEALAARREWLVQAERALAEFGG
jgi:hypothetical protein